MKLQNWRITSRVFLYHPPHSGILNEGACAFRARYLTLFGMTGYTRDDGYTWNYKQAQNEGGPRRMTIPTKLLQSVTNNPNPLALTRQLRPLLPQERS